MRTPPPGPAALFAACAAVLIAGCTTDEPPSGPDPSTTPTTTLTEGSPPDEVDEGDPSDAPDPPDASDASDESDAVDGQVPPLLAVIDGWPETTVTLESDPPVTVVAKVADAPDRRQQGLMRVPELPAGVGMLFLFDEARTGGFWMKDTLVPLDIAYVRDGEVVSVMQMEPCGADPCPSYDPGIAYDAALEVNLGALETAGVGPGTRVTWTPPEEAAP